MNSRSCKCIVNKVRGRNWKGETVITDTWTLFSKQGLVMVFLAGRSDASIPQIADAVGISERYAARILRDFRAAGLVRAHRVGTRNHYEVNMDAELDHPLLRHRRVGDVIATLTHRDSTGDP